MEWYLVFRSEPLDKVLSIISVHQQGYGRGEVDEDKFEDGKTVNDPVTHKLRNAAREIMDNNDEKN